jgi:Protein of unknown function (DUF2852)
MASATNQDAYGNPAWGSPSGGQWGQPGPGWASQQQTGGNPPPWQQRGPWGGPPFWHPAGISRPAAIAFTVLGFMFWWPVGLALLIYMLGSGRMGCFGRRRRAMYQAQNWGDAGPWGAWKSWACGSNDRPAASSGNHAFDEYKTETLRRLEEEQKEFGSFLERLRFAKDKAEFDQFMADRRGRPPAPPTEEQPSA